MKSEKIVQDAKHDAIVYANEYGGKLPDFYSGSCGGWVDTLIDACGSGEIRKEYEIKNDDDWHEFLNLYESACTQEIDRILED